MTIHTVKNKILQYCNGLNMFWGIRGECYSWSLKLFMSKPNHPRVISLMQWGDAAERALYVSQETNPRQTLTVIILGTGTLDL